MLESEVRVSLSPLLMGRLAPHERAVLRAGSDALRSMNAEAVRQVRQRRALKARAIRDALTTRGPIGGGGGVIRWRMEVSGAPMPVASYPHRQTKQGVSVQIKAGGGRALIRHAFVAQMRSGHTGVFFRQGKARLPIEEAFSTRVVDVFHDEGFVDELLERAREVFARTYARNLAAVVRGTLT